MQDQPAVKVEQLTYTYDKAQAPSLDQIQLEIRRGSFIAVMGETGAGKTSLLMTLNGLIPQFLEGEFHGEVTIAGYSTQQVPVQNLIQEMGLVLQDPDTQIFGLTVWEDAAFGPSNLGVPLDEIHRRVDTALERVGLAHFHERSTEFLSGGEKQRLAVAGVLAIGPSILALDEPTSELDPEGKDAIFEIVDSLKHEHGMTIILAEHESERVLAHADAVVVLQEGKVVWRGEPQMLFADEESVRRFQLRPPGIATLFWELRKQGIGLGDACPRTVQEMAARLLANEQKEQGRAVDREGHEPFLAATQFDAAAVGERRDEAPILSINNLTHTYHNGHQALKGIDLDVYAGDYIAIIGQNGAGKSTLCKHFNRLLTPTGGSILFQGESIAGKDTADLARHIGYVFQNPDHQIFSASVLEEVMYGLRIQGFSESEQKEKALEVLAFVGLDAYSERHPFSLGKGLRQRLAVATILALEPQILIIDEPTTGQDWRGTQSMLELIGKLHERGHTIILITHNMQIVTEHAKRVLIMGQGRILKDCKPWQAFEDPAILKAANIKPTQLVQLESELAAMSGFVSQHGGERALVKAIVKGMGRDA
ncbi:UNVERIFIED_CONTAM: energy-coupling factor transporter ATP-binding protein EcfA2 [Brevibacillus sp. OAP136]